MKFQQGDLVLHKKQGIHGIVVRLGSQDIFQTDKSDSLVNVLWHTADSRPRWVMGSSLVKANA